MVLLLGCQAAEWMALQRRLLCAHTIPQTYSKQFRCQDSRAGKAVLPPANRPITQRAEDTRLRANILTGNMVAGSSPHPTVVPYPSQRCYLQGVAVKRHFRCVAVSDCTPQAITKVRPAPTPDSKIPVVSGGT